MTEIQCRRPARKALRAPVIREESDEGSDVCEALSSCESGESVTETKKSSKKKVQKEPRHAAWYVHSASNTSAHCCCGQKIEGGTLAIGRKFSRNYVTWYHLAHAKGLPSPLKKSSAASQYKGYEEISPLHKAELHHFLGDHDYRALKKRFGPIDKTPGKHCWFFKNPRNFCCEHCARQSPFSLCPKCPSHQLLNNADEGRLLAVLTIPVHCNVGPRPETGTKLNVQWILTYHLRQLEFYWPDGTAAGAPAQPISYELSKILDKLRLDASASVVDSPEGVVDWGGLEPPPSERMFVNLSIYTRAAPGRFNTIAATMKERVKSASHIHIVRVAEAGPTPGSDPDSAKSQQELEDFFDGGVAALEGIQPFDATQAAPALIPKLLPYQAQGVAWMLRREVTADCSRESMTQLPSLPPFWDNLTAQDVRTEHVADSEQESLPSSRTQLTGQGRKGSSTSKDSTTCTKKVTGRKKAAPRGKKAKKEGDGEKTIIGYVNTLTGIKQTERPSEVSGGILADDMGLGKTVQLIALLVAHPRPDSLESSAQDAKPKASGKGKSLPAKAKSVEKKLNGATSEDMWQSGTIVVCPVSVLQSWQVQLSQHVAPGALRVCTYYGPRRHDLAISGKLSSYDVVLTSYDTLRSEFTTPARLSRSKPKRKRVRNDSCTEEESETEDSSSDEEESGVQNDEDVKEGTSMGESSKPATKQAGQASSAASTKSTARKAAAKAPSVPASRKRTAASAFEKERKEQYSQGKGDEELGKGPLYRYKWWRVVLDEAHAIKDRLSMTHRACSFLQSDIRWCLTGTPLQNRLEDIQALFSFLKLEPLSDPSVWKKSISLPVISEDPLGLSRLRVAMQSVCIRRSKTVLGSILPPKTVEIRTVDMSGPAREIYDILLRSGRAAFQGLQQDGNREVLKHYAGVLECLLRLRQACCSAALLPPDRVKRALKVLNELEERQKIAREKALKDQQSAEAPLLDAVEATRLLAKLMGVLGGEDDCSICLENLDSNTGRILRGCRHTFCADCLSHMFESGRRSVCALCRAPFARKDVLSLDNVAPHVPDVEHETSGGNDCEGPDLKDFQHPKVKALVSDVVAAKATDPAVRSVVFSQFIGFLDVIQVALEEAGISTCRLEGKMRLEERVAVLGQFEKADGPDVLLVSTRVGGVGLTLTRASRVYIMDLWWNASVDEQAVDRVHRFGQTRPVTVVRFICAASVEERMLELQRRKIRLGAAALRRLEPDEVRDLRVEQLRLLFAESDDA